MRRARASAVALGGGAAAAACAAALAPLWTYALSLALLGLPHVAAELRYVDGRFGSRLGRGLARPLWLGLAAVVALRLAGLGGVGAHATRAGLEVGLGALLAALVLPALARRGAGPAALGGATLLGALVAARVAPVDALVWFAFAHNLTPVAFLAERLEGRGRRRALVACAALFGALPLALASGAVRAGLAGLGLAPTALGPPLLGGLGSVDAHLGAFVAPALGGGPRTVDLFCAAAYLQVAHHAAVLFVLPRLGAGDAPAAPPRLWPREARSARAARLAVAFGAALLGAGYVASFRDARALYGVFAAVHAWVEVPVLLLALAAPAPARGASEGRLPGSGAAEARPSR